MSEQDTQPGCGEMVQRAKLALQERGQLWVSFADFTLSISDSKAEEMVLAVIAAIREPTEAMLSAPEMDIGNHGECIPNSAENVWRAMIDEALK